MVYNTETEGSYKLFAVSGHDVNSYVRTQKDEGNEQCHQVAVKRWGDTKALEDVVKGHKKHLSTTMEGDQNNFLGCRILMILFPQTK